MLPPKGWGTNGRVTSQLRYRSVRPPVFRNSPKLSKPYVTRLSGCWLKGFCGEIRLLKEELFLY
jgi:hypothetical protein